MSSVPPVYYESNIPNQPFGVDFSTPMAYPVSGIALGMGRLAIPTPNPNYCNRPWRPVSASHNPCSNLIIDNNKFQATLHVPQFAPNEISVKVTGEAVVVVEAKHGEKQDHHGYVSRQLIRRYIVPEDYDLEKIHSTLSCDGTLTVTVPIFNYWEERERTVPIVQTGVSVMRPHAAGVTAKVPINKAVGTPGAKAAKSAVPAKAAGAASAPESKAKAAANPKAEENKEEKQEEQKDE